MSKILDLKRMIQATLKNIEKLEHRLEKEEGKTRQKKHLIAALKADIRDEYKELNTYRNRLYPLIGLKGEKNVESSAPQQS